MAHATCAPNNRLTRAHKFGRYHSAAALLQTQTACFLPHSSANASRYLTPGGYHSRHHHVQPAPAPVSFDQGGYQSRPHIYPSNHRHLYYGNEHVVTSGHAVWARVAEIAQHGAM